jgi:murein DD-endopeptidase MepM/ murein hydrolase activator NlpD
MGFEPFSREGLRSLMNKFTNSHPSAAARNSAGRFRFGRRWIALAVCVGFGLAYQMGSGDREEASAGFELASYAVPPSASGRAADVGRGLPESLSALAMMKQNAASLRSDQSVISIDSLPIHRNDAEANAIESLTIVTRGVIRQGESLGSSLHRQGISPAAVQLIASKLRKVFDFRRSRSGDTYRLGQNSDGRVLDFRYSQGPEESFYLAWEGTRYVVRRETAELRPQITKIAGVIDSSFYGAIQASGERSALAGQFAQILAWDIDFSRNVHPGDEFQILYERLYRRNDEGDEIYVRPGRILAGRYDGKVGEYTVVYFEDEPGVGAYFRPDGSSVERAFLAAPLKFSRISSRFTKARRHPILKVTRPHPGIDYAAPPGTPIWAVANGVVEYRSWAGASGNLVRIRHAGGYTSHYAHLSKFASGLSVGDRVDQKELIGYVGSTGLSTGPHVCFRVKLDGRYVDPMGIKSSAGEPVDGEKRIVFERVRDQLLADLGPGPLSLADEAL